MIVSNFSYLYGKCMEIILIIDIYSYVFMIGKVYKLKLISTGPKTEHESVAENCEIRYVTGQRGSRKIVCGGYSYICAKINGDRKYWVCAKQRSRNCKARLITNAEETLFIRRNQQHNHDSENSASNN